MNALHPIFQGIVEAHGMVEPRAVPYAATKFDAFKVDNSYASSKASTYSLGSLSETSLRPALNEALSRFALYHKDHLILRETGEQGVKLRLFAIRKKSAARYVHKDHVTRAVHDLYADPVCVIDGALLGVKP